MIGRVKQDIHLQQLSQTKQKNLSHPLQIGVDLQHPCSRGSNSQEDGLMLTRKICDPPFPPPTHPNEVLYKVGVGISTRLLLGLSWTIVKYNFDFRGQAQILRQCLL